MQALYNGVYNSEGRSVCSGSLEENSAYGHRCARWKDNAIWYEDKGAVIEQRHLVTLGIFLGILGASISASAQNFVTPSAEQLDLYEAGNKAFQEKRYKQAVEYFRASLAVGEMNITYLNLGRALFKAGDCFEAKETFDKVSSSPAIQSPSPVQVLQKLEEYRADLKTCPGSVVVACKPAELKLSIDGGEPQDCSTEPMMLSPGEHKIVGMLQEKTTEKVVKVEALGKAKVS